MRCLTLSQPWATLVAIGAKKIETRSWNTNYRGPLAIHAAKCFPKWAEALCHDEPFRLALLNAGVKSTSKYDLPLGAIVATCELVATIQTGAAQAAYSLTDYEIAFGDYSPGRWAWRLVNVQKLSEPIPAKGMLGLWETKAHDRVDAVYLDSLWRKER